MQHVLRPFIFCLAMLAGYLVTVDSWNGDVFVYLGERRAPASVRSMRDYSAVDRRALSASVHKQLLDGAKILKESDHLVLSFGHPLMRDEERTEFACPLAGRPGFFDRVEFTFLGLGISEAGEQARMVIEADCRASGNGGVSRLDPIWLPMKEIMATPAKDGELQFYGDHAVDIHLSHMPGEWPSSWMLSSVRIFRRDEPSEQLLIDTDKMRESNGKVMTFDWGE